MGCLLDHDGKALYEPEELSAILGADTDAKAESVGLRYRHQTVTILEKRAEMIELRDKRALTGAFLPDDGLPFRARMALILKGVS